MEEEVVITNPCIQIPDLLSVISDSEDPGSGHNRVPRLGGHLGGLLENRGDIGPTSLSRLYSPDLGGPALGPPQTVSWKTSGPGEDLTATGPEWSPETNETYETSETMRLRRRYLVS